MKWSIHDREDVELSKELFDSALRDNDYPAVWVHSDNGHPMKGATLLGLFYELGVCNSYSRPRVSNDNPFIESWFKTMKYSVSYPNQFSNIDDAREWFGSFVSFYNTEHKHSGTNFMTPTQVRNGEYTALAKNRNKVMLKAKEENPNRWGCRKTKQLLEVHTVTLNPVSFTTVSKKKKRQKKSA